jgi:hypothetical protein
VKAPHQNPDFQGGHVSKRIVATFHPQAWQNDYAIPVDPEGEVTFDVTDEILKIGREKALSIRDDEYESDHLRFSSNSPEWIREWSGPFYIEIQSSINEYFTH